MYKIRIKGKGLIRAQYQNSEVDTSDDDVFEPISFKVPSPEDEMLPDEYAKEREKDRKEVQDWEKRNEFIPLGSQQDQTDAKYKSDPFFQAKYDFSLIGAQDSKKQQRKYNKFIQKKYDPFYKQRRLGNALKATSLGIAGASAAMDYFTDRKKQKDWNKWFRSQSLPDNMYAVGAPNDRGDFDINEGVYRPNQLTPPNPGAYYGARYGGQQSTDPSMKLIKIRMKSSPESMEYGGQNRTGMSLGLDLGQRNVYRDMPKEKSEHTRDVIPESPRDKANIEAELGETVYGDLDGDGALEHMKIGGKRHTEGGTPLNVPEGSFIFSDTKKMIIKDPVILERFGMKPRKEGYTPAEIAKKYDINKYKAIMEDPNVDSVRKSTAQLMIKNFQKKLAELALIQEGMKGFPQGVPQVARQTLPEAEQLAQSMEQERVMEQGPSVEQQEGMAPPMGQQPYPEDDQMMDQEQMAAMQSEEEPMMRYGGHMPMYQGDQGASTLNLFNQMQNAGRANAQTSSGVPYDPTEDNQIVPWAGDVNENKANKSKYTKEQWAQKLRAAGYTGPLTNEAVQKWLYEQEKSKAVIDQLHQQYGMPKQGMFDKKLGYRWDDALDSLEQIPETGGVIGYLCVNGKVQATTYKDEAARSSAGAKLTPAEAGINCAPGVTPNNMDVNNKQSTSRIRGRWMTPDKVNMFAAAAVPPRKYLPYAAPVGYEPNRLSLEDYRAQLAAEQSMYNKQAETMGVYGPTAGQAANQSFAAGQQAERAGNVISGVTSRNVDRVNQFLAQERARKDQFNLLGAERATSLFDKNTIANQQYDNARRQYINNMAKTFGQGWQNAMKLGMLNATNPRFKVDPRSGDTYYTGLGYGNNRLGSNSSGYTMSDFGSLKAKYMGLNMSEAMAEKQALEDIKGSKSSTSNDSGQSWLPNYDFNFGLPS